MHVCKMSLTKGSRMKSSWWLIASLILGILWIPLSNGQGDSGSPTDAPAASPTGTDDVSSTTTAKGNGTSATEAPSSGESMLGEKLDEHPGLTKHYERLYNYYDKNTVEWDCKQKSSDSKSDHSHWGTTDTLKFLTGKMDRKSMTAAENATVLPKLRIYLARVGYLKDPGSLVFLDKQAPTIRLTCPKEAMWRQQGEPGEDLKFQEKGLKGDKYKDQAPNGFTYLHKYTCFNVKEGERCSHTFYVITKMLPELPFGYLVRSGETSPEYAFACTAPFCRLKDCEKPGTVGGVISRRAYPPFKITWRVELQNKTVLMISQKNVNKESGELMNDTSFKIVWDNKIRMDKEKPFDEEKSYMAVGADEKKNAFYMTANDSGPGFFQSRIQIKGANADVHEGKYECIIEDANGIVTTPNNDDFTDYRGRAHIYVIMNMLAIILFGVAGGCIVLVGLIILICPKKMEHDDGTAYSADELVTPAEIENPDPVSESNPAETEVAKSKGNVSSKSAKVE